MANCLWRSARFFRAVLAVSGSHLNLYICGSLLIVTLPLAAAPRKIARDATRPSSRLIETFPGIQPNRLGKFPQRLGSDLGFWDRTPNHMADDFGSRGRSYRPRLSVCGRA